MILGEISQRLNRDASTCSPQILSYTKRRTRFGAPALNGRSYDEDELRRFEVENDGFPLAATKEEIREFDKCFLSGKPRRQKKKLKSRSLTEVVSQASLRLQALSKSKFVDKLIAGATSLARKSTAKQNEHQKQSPSLDQTNSDSSNNLPSAHLIETEENPTASVVDTEEVSEIEFVVDDAKFCSCCNSQVLFENVKSCSTEIDDSGVICFICQIEKCNLLLNEECDLPEDDEDSGFALTVESSVQLPEDSIHDLLIPAVSSSSSEKIQENCNYNRDSEPDPEDVDSKQDPDTSDPFSLIVPGHVKRQCQALFKSQQFYKGSPSVKLVGNRSESENHISADTSERTQKESPSSKAKHNNKLTKNCFNLANDSTFSQTVMAKGFVKALAEHIDKEGFLKQISNDEDDEDNRNLVHISQQTSEQKHFKGRPPASQERDTIMVRSDGSNNTLHSDNLISLNSNLAAKFLQKVQDDFFLDQTTEKLSPHKDDKIVKNSKQFKASPMANDSSSAYGDGTNISKLCQNNKLSFTLPRGMKLIPPSRDTPNPSPKPSPVHSAPQSPTYAQDKLDIKCGSKPKIPLKPPPKSAALNNISRTPPSSSQALALPPSASYTSVNQPPLPSNPPQKPSNPPPLPSDPPPLPSNPPRTPNKPRVSLTRELNSVTVPSSQSPTLLSSSSLMKSPSPKALIPSSPVAESLTPSSPKSLIIQPPKSPLLPPKLQPSPKPTPPPKPSSLSPSFTDPMLQIHKSPPITPPKTPPKTPAISPTASPTKSPPAPPKRVSPSAVLQPNASTNFTKPQEILHFNYESHIDIDSGSQSEAPLRRMTGAQNSSNTYPSSDEVSLQPVSKHSTYQYRHAVLSSIFDNSAPLNAAELFDSSWSDSDSFDDFSDEDNDDDDGRHIRPTHNIDLMNQNPGASLDHSMRKASESSDVQHRDKRFRIAEELLLTERDYVERLNLLHQIFYSRLNEENHQQALMPADVLQHMFSNTRSIFIFHHDFLLPQLEIRMKHWERDPRIGDLMKKNAPFLKMYTEYIANFDNAMKLINQWMEKSSRFSEIIQDIQKLPQCRNLSLQHHMLGPIQRVPRYELLLKDYVKHLPEGSPDMNDAKDALDLVTKAANHSNEAMKKIETFHKLLDIYQSLRGVSVDFISPTREFVSQGPVTKISARSGEKQPRHIFLFNDLMLVCTQYSLLNTYSVRSQLEVDGMEIKSGTNMNIPNTFLVHGKQKAVEFLDENLDGESCGWYEKIRNVIESYKKKKHCIRQEAPKNITLETRTSIKNVGKIAPVWIQDVAATMCMLCKVSFNMVRRRHHCRACGKLICKTCCKKAPLEYLNGKIERVCIDCYNIIVNKDGKGSTDSPDCIKSPEKKGVLHVKANMGLISGYMHCSSDGGHSWQRLWVTAHKDFVLYTFRAHEDVSATSSLPLPGHEVGQVWDLDGRDHVFCLSHKKIKLHMFQTDNDKHLRRWMSVLSKLIQAELPDENSRLSSQSNSSNSSSVSDSGTINNSIDTSSSKRGSTHSGSQADSGYPGDSSNSLAALAMDDGYQDDGISQDDNVDCGVGE